MLIIHTADVHLDSKLNRYFDSAKAAERRNEIIRNFQRMIEYGAEKGVRGIIIAGDLFDVRNISAMARDAVYSSINNNSDIEFYYLAGNHDADAFIRQITDKYGDIPENLHLFSDTWTSYELVCPQTGVSVVITGAELNERNNKKLVDSLLLDRNRINIVTLHGQEVETAGKKDAEVIPLREYRDRGIDYLALGHIHEPKYEKLDARGYYSYAGCPEGRGFDEVGPRGFNLLDVSEKGIERTFVPFASRIIYDVSVDVSEAATSDDAIKLIRDALMDAGVTDRDMVKVRLAGNISLDALLDTGFIAGSLMDDYYFVKVVDETKPFIDYEEFAADKSLKGEYVRLVKAMAEAGEIDADEAEECIAMGVRILMGEEKLV